MPAWLPAFCSLPITDVRCGWHGDCPGMLFTVVWLLLIISAHLLSSASDTHQSSTDFYLYAQVGLFCQPFLPSFVLCNINISSYYQLCCFPFWLSAIWSLSPIEKTSSNATLLSVSQYFNLSQGFLSWDSWDVFFYSNLLLERPLNGQACGIGINQEQDALRGLMGRLWAPNSHHE